MSALKLLYCFANFKNTQTQERTNKYIFDLDIHNTYVDEPYQMKAMY